MVRSSTYLDAAGKGQFAASMAVVRRVGHDKGSAVNVVIHDICGYQDIPNGKFWDESARYPRKHHSAHLKSSHSSRETWNGGYCQPVTKMRLLHGLGGGKQPVSQLFKQMNLTYLETLNQNRCRSSCGYHTHARGAENN